MKRLDDLQLLSQARQRAKSLFEDLLHHQAELDTVPPKDDPVQLETGRQALRHAVDSARRMVHSIEQALAAARESQDPS